MISTLSYTQTPISQLELPQAIDAKVKLLIKREDLNHPLVSGNKWWKLKYNLEAARQHGHDTLLTFGGAYSNHIFATAAAAREMGFKSIGVIRGEEVRPLNDTLAFAEQCAMTLQFVSREAYRAKTEETFIQDLLQRFGNFYLIPEGGTNAFAVQGVAEFAHQLRQELEFDYVCLPVGTGGTMAGMIRGLEGYSTIVGFPVLKGAQFLEAEINERVDHNNWSLCYDYHGGGYGKWTDSLINFIQKFRSDHKIPLDRIYTGKMIYGVIDLLKQSHFKKGSTVLIIHTGGLQGGRIQ